MFIYTQNFQKTKNQKLIFIIFLQYIQQNIKNVKYIS
jgi:hypothetical protein